MNGILKYFKGDKVIWVIAILLSIVSLLVVYSAAGQLAFRFKNGNTEYYLVQRIIMLSIGLGLMYLVHQVKYTVFSKLAVIGYWLSVPLLILTLVLGSTINDASRWLTIPGLPISFQTSDLAKLALILYVSRKIGKNQENIKDFRTGFLPVAIPVVVICGLILPANFSTAAMLFATCILIMFIGRVSLKHIGLLIGTAIAGFGFLILLSFAAPKLLPRLETWKNRIENFGKPSEEDRTQVDFAKMAIADGGIFGTGPGNNLNKYRLPQGYSDFIYAMIIGEYGSVIGGIGVLLLYLILLYRALRIATRSEYAIATLVAVGLSLSLVFQAFVNMAVAVNILPVTGQPLPLVSMGGTSTLFTAITLGIILSVSRTLDKNETYAPEESHH